MKNWSWLYDHMDDTQHDQHVWEYKFYLTLGRA